MEAIFPALEHVPAAFKPVVLGKDKIEHKVIIVKMLHTEMFA